MKPLIHYVPTLNSLLIVLFSPTIPIYSIKNYSATDFSVANISARVTLHGLPQNYYDSLKYK